MNEMTILLWITIFIIGVIAIILVKLHFKGDKLEKDKDSIMSNESINGIPSFNRKQESDNSIRQNYSQQNFDNTNYIEEVPDEEIVSYADYEAESSSNNLEYESQNQVLINYENEVKKFQEPMKEYQVEIMTQDNNQKEKNELKDLFTIDELIKESKRKDSEREKESQQINHDEDAELNELKESIIKRNENEQIEDQLIEEILADEEIKEILSNDEADESAQSETVEETVKSEEPTIQEIIDNEENKEEPTIQEIIDNEENKEEPTIQEIIDNEEKKEETVEEVPDSEESVQEVLEVETKEEPVEETAETPLVASQKDIDEAISNASQEIEEEKVEDISDNENITDALLNTEEEIAPEIKEPVLKSPTKIEQEDPIPEIETPKEEEVNELDYRKDLEKITNKIKGSSIFKEVKERLSSEPEEELYPLEDFEETYIRNVNEFEGYDEYEPIINETHEEFGEVYEPDYDEAIRQENTRKLFNNANQAPEPEIAQPKVGTIKSKPSRANLKIELNNREVVLKKGDEIIFKHDGETYSSQVYAINGDDISVKYRGKNIKIKSEDVKKIY